MTDSATGDIDGPSADPVTSGTGGPSASLVHNRANPVTLDVQRVTRALGAQVPTSSESVVVKTITPHGKVVVPHWTAGTKPSHWNYWRREVLAYSHRVTEAFTAGGIRGPKLLEVVEVADGSVQLWLEDVDGRSGHDLALDDHVRLAHGMGRAQGELAAEPASSELLAQPFLSRQWIRSYALSRPAGPAIHADLEAWEHPVVVAGFGEARHRLRARFGELYRTAPQWFDLLESLPRTLCHLDYWPNNAIAAGDSTRADDVLVDWAFVGDGAVGEDPGNWVPDTFFDHFLEPERFEEVDSAIWQAYATGLETTRWSAPVELARLAMCASAVKYVWLPGLMVSTADHKGPTGYGGQPSYPLEEVFRRRAVTFEYLLGWIDEAVALGRALGLDVPG